MDKFTTLEGVAAPLKIINVDTDMIIPKQYLKTIKRTGLGKGLFSEQRYKDDGSENPDFVLNQSAYRNAKVLVAGDNFGCGSSREHAPWALLDYGIRCVIAPSFADIFYNNCFKNGILPIKVPKEIADELMEDAKKGANAVMTIDLDRQQPVLERIVAEDVGDLGADHGAKAKIEQRPGRVLARRAAAEITAGDQYRAAGGLRAIQRKLGLDRAIGTEAPVRKQLPTKSVPRGGA